MRNKLQEALKLSKADYTEIRIEERESARISYFIPDHTLMVDGVQTAA